MFQLRYEILTWRSKEDFILLHYKTPFKNRTNKMTTATKIQLPYLEDTGLDGKKIYTPREWTERFRHYVKRIHNIDIKEILTDDTVPTDENWNKKNQKSDKISFGAPDRRLSNLSPKESSTQTLTRSKPKNYYNYSGNTICPKETPTTVVETSSGQNKKKTKPPENTGKN